MGKQMYRKTVLNVLILSMLFVTGCSSLLSNSDAKLLSSPDFIQTASDIDTIVSQIKDKHSVCIYYKDNPLFSWVRYKYKLAPKSDYTRVLKYLTVLQKELDKYPDDFWHNAGVNSIVVCKDLSSYGYYAHGFANPWSKTVYYNYNMCIKIYSKKTIHHELYHMIEAKYNGNIYYKDPVWAKFNSKEFKYGRGGRFFKWNDSNTKERYHPSEGFVSPYAASALEEDKAEVYSNLFVEEISACLNDWIKEDEILKNKVDYMKDFLLQICDEMTPDFWANLCAEECLPPELSSAREYEIQDSRFSLTLSDDAAVELIAIAEDSGGSEKWWKPNGEIFDEPSFAIPEVSEAKITFDDKLKRYHFFYYVKNNQFPQSTHSQNIPEGKIYRVQEPYHSKNGLLYLGVCTMICVLDKDKETSQLLIGVPLDEWLTKASYNPKTKVTAGLDHSVKFNKPRRKKGKIEIELSCSITDIQNMAHQLVVVDNNEKIHHPEYIRGEPVENEVQISLGFGDLRLAQVKEFQFRTCPYTWITFENISLRPGQITDVQVKVGNE